MHSNSNMCNFLHFACVVSVGISSQESDWMVGLARDDTALEIDCGAICCFFFSKGVLITRADYFGPILDDRLKEKILKP